jgi:hypothetical protein
MASASDQLTIHNPNDNTPEDVGKAMMRAQVYIHTVGAGQPLSEALDQFSQIVRSWAMHPKGRNWSLIGDIEEWLKSCEYSDV